MDIALSEIEAAAERISKFAVKTSLLRSSTFSRFFQAEVYLKCENLQKTGSFKVRGAGNKIMKMAESGQKAPIVASSAGNHAQGVAYSATQCGIPSTIVMPATAPLAKVEATKGYGAEVVLHGTCYDDAYTKAREICDERGAVFLHPYDDADVIAGQGTIGLEIMEQLPDTDIVLVPAGGGGLLSGVAAAVKQINPNVKVIGVQAEGADAIARSFREKKRVCTDTACTMADGIAVKKPGEITCELINRYVDDVVTVSESSIYAALTFLIERNKLVVEAAGSVPIATLLENKVDVAGKKVVCVLSGGNIDISSILMVLQKGMIARHRWIMMDVLYIPSSTSMQKILRTFSDVGANIFSLNQEPTVHPMDMNEHRIHIFCEVKDQEHEGILIRKLEEDGCRILTDI